MIGRRVTGAVLASLFLAASGCASSAAQGEQAITASAWLRSTPPWTNTAAIYATVNGGTLDDELVGVSSARCAEVELHRSSLAGGIAVMDPVEDGIPIPAAGAVTLEPGGLHAMCLEFDVPFVAGELVPLQLHFESGLSVGVDAVVRTP